MLGSDLGVLWHRWSVNQARVGSPISQQIRAASLRMGPLFVPQFPKTSPGRLQKVEALRPLLLGLSQRCVSYDYALGRAHDRPRLPRVTY